MEHAHQWGPASSVKPRTWTKVLLGSTTGLLPFSSVGHSGVKWGDEEMGSCGLDCFDRSALALV